MTKLTVSFTDDNGEPDWEVTTKVDTTDHAEIIAAAKAAAELYVSDLEEVHA